MIDYLKYFDRDFTCLKMSVRIFLPTIPSVLLIFSQL